MILVDNNEPTDMVELLKKSVPVVVSPLNQLHMSDYFFGNAEGQRFQFSRKQAAELLGDLDEAEDQLRDYYDKADVNYQIVEGMVSPYPITGIPIKDRKYVGGASTRPQPTVYAYHFPPNQPPQGYEFNTIHTLSLLYAWEHRLDRAGITTYWVTNWHETVRFILAAYHNEQKPQDEHSTLQRIIKPKIRIKKQDPFVKALMFLSSAYKLNVGEKTAVLIANKFVNIMDLVLASVDEITEIEGIGAKTAEKILKALGRTI
jgi:hypothetical protein